MKKYLYLNSRDELYKIDIAKIVYFEAEGNYTNFYLSNKLKGAVCMNLAQMQKLIAENLSDPRRQEPHHQPRLCIPDQRVEAETGAQRRRGVRLSREHF